MPTTASMEAKFGPEALRTLVLANPARNPVTTALEQHGEHRAQLDQDGQRLDHNDLLRCGQAGPATFNN